VKLFVLTGAGVSAESGVSTFRDAGGIWTKYDFREVATPEGFARDPAKVHAFYNWRRKFLQQAEPNAAHRALARLQTELAARGGELFLCTQNVDDLHERGGATQVLHMHGELLKVRCTNCGTSREERGEISVETVCKRCGTNGGLRPDVVWFGETPRSLDLISAKVAQADLFLSLGTSGTVYPAAGLVAEARAAGVRTCELSLEPSENARAFDEARYGPATEIVPAWVDDLLSGLEARAFKAG
jgi:NAD-dependent deacetylase